MSSQLSALAIVAHTAITNMSSNLCRHLFTMRGSSKLSKHSTHAPSTLIVFPLSCFLLSPLFSLYSFSCLSPSGRPLPPNRDQRHLDIPILRLLQAIRDVPAFGRRQGGAHTEALRVKPLARQVSHNRLRARIRRVENILLGERRIVLGPRRCSHNFQVNAGAAVQYGHYAWIQDAPRCLRH